MKCLILDILALYGCKSPSGAKSRGVSPSLKIPDTVYEYVDGQYKIYISKAQYEKYYTMLIRGYEDRPREVGPFLRTIMVNKDNIVIEPSKYVHLEDLRKLIPSTDKIHGEEYQSLLSIIERRFIKCECDKLIICLDDVLSYDNLLNTLKKYLGNENLDQCPAELNK